MATVTAYASERVRAALNAVVPLITRVRKTLVMQLAGNDSTFTVPPGPSAIDLPPPVAVETGYMYLNRPVVVISQLQMLHGKTTGTVRLPVELYWSGTAESAVFDLGNTVRRLQMYRTVLREARRPEQLAEFLNATALERDWPRIAPRLPDEVRNAWQERYPESLRPAAALPAAS
jgi:hypothetical protein